ncbi:putative flagellar biosynthesis protein FlhG [Catonella morbi ATCC 51271]|uniref:Putative flagellar biosynthesis protein FlhG n=1 Tax=Catonella morbi ATCC 51271 TaxID=592026 RepID=V2XYY9_9FIRM|nr:MinD/ParA family protein [Catonella morbi]ESL01948.1 putative flagellar biosynthesis protein FlhG [Catonella morbi ATCC 51271]
MDQAQNLRNIIKAGGTKEVLSRVITVTSGKGGVGKSNLAINLAISLSRLGKKVVVLDADFGLANIEVMLGIRPQYNLSDLMFRGKSLSEIITEGPENVGFISGGSGIREMTNLTKEQLINLSARLSELDRQTDVVIIDTGAGISGNVMEFVVLSGEVLLIATPEPTSITDAYALLKTLNYQPEFTREHCHIKLIANKVRNEKDGRELFEKLSVVADKFLNISLEYMGAVPSDNNMSKAVMKQQPLSVAYPNSQAARAIDDMARILAAPQGEAVIKPVRRGLVGIFSETLKRTLKGKERG